MTYSLVRRAIFAAVLLFMWSSPSSSAEPANAKATNQAESSQEQPDPWKRFVPPEDHQFDWIQLVSGEWLKGEIRRYYNFKLEFDSDNLDMLTLDWDDVKQLRSAGPKSVYLEQNHGASPPITVVGILHVIGNKVDMMTAQGEKAFNRNDIISISDGSGIRWGLWSGTLSFGGNVRSGNTNVTDINTNLLVVRRTVKSQYYFNYVANFSRSEGIETSNNHRLTTFYDRLTSSRSFWRTATFEYYRDRFRNIEDQYSLGTSYGYQFIRSPKTEWSGLIGLGAIQSRYVSVEVGQDIESRSPQAEFRTRLDTELTDKVDYLFDYSFKVVDNDSGKLIQHLSTTLSTDLVGDLNLDISFVWDRVQNPQPKSDGTIPERDDYQLIIGVSYEL